MNLKPPFIDLDNWTHAGDIAEQLVAQQLGFKPEWIEPENEIASLMNSVAGDMERIEARQRRIEQLLQRMSDTKLRAVK